MLCIWKDSIGHVKLARLNKIVEEHQLNVEQVRVVMCLYIYCK